MWQNQMKIKNCSHFTKKMKIERFEYFKFIPRYFVGIVNAFNIINMSSSKPQSFDICKDEFDSFVWKEFNLKKIGNFFDGIIQNRTFQHLSSRKQENVERRILHFAKNCICDDSHRKVQWSSYLTIKGMSDFHHNDSKFYFISLFMHFKRHLLYQPNT